MDKKLELVKEWLNKASHDLQMAELALKYKPELRDSICFHCQQAVEKSLKAHLVFLDIPFKKTHSLTYLLDLINEKDSISEEVYSQIELLESYAVEIRYPEGGYEPTESETQKVYNIAVEIMALISKKIRLGEE